METLNWIVHFRGFHQKIIESISINEMTVSPEGFVTLYYDDGDMFWGHSIEIDVEADGTVSDADIAG